MLDVLASSGFGGEKMGWIYGESEAIFSGKISQTK